jgi:hypothetical protein
MMYVGLFGMEAYDRDHDVTLINNRLEQSDGNSGVSEHYDWQSGVH